MKEKEERIVDLMEQAACYWLERFKTITRFRIGPEHYKKLNAEFYPIERIVDKIPQSEGKVVKCILECGEVEIVEDLRVWGFVADLEGYPIEPIPEFKPSSYEEKPPL